uniref:Uncharacterized protein n=1 Tax=Anguilla anguilla TaxID=7936 RepID=A0A0E9PRH8_ANGAN
MYEHLPSCLQQAFYTPNYDSSSNPACGSVLICCLAFHSAHYYYNYGHYVITV